MHPLRKNYPPPCVHRKKEKKKMKEEIKMNEKLRVGILGATGMVGQRFIAFLENNLRADGSVAIPEVLRPYMGGMTELVPVN